MWYVHTIEYYLALKKKEILQYTTWMNFEEGFPGGTSDKEPTCQCKFNPWVRKMQWGQEQQPTPVFLPGEPQGHRSLEGNSP